MLLLRIIRHQANRAGSGTVSARAFSLIELLVVISIIAIIVGITIPALSLARESARLTECANNQKQIGIAVGAYSSQHDGRLPGTATGSGSDLTGALESYTSVDWESKMWSCPSHSGFTPSPATTTSYGYNWQYLLISGPSYPHSQWSGFANKGQRIEQLSRPSSTISFIDHEKPASNSNLWSYVARPSDTPADGQGMVAKRHSEKPNALFCDGHVNQLEETVALPANEAEFWDPR